VALIANLSEDVGVLASSKDTNDVADRDTFKAKAEQYCVGCEKPTIVGPYCLLHSIAYLLSVVNAAERFASQPGSLAQLGSILYQPHRSEHLPG
jgi:hypothetical protein